MSSLTLSSAASCSVVSVSARDSRSTLFTATVTGVFALAERLCDEAIPGADPLLAVEDQQGDIAALELLLHAPCHPRGELISRTLDTRQVDEDELAVARGVHSSDRPPAWSGAGRRRSRSSLRR